jgi:multidrug efflux pump
MNLVERAIRNARLTISVLVFLMLAGALAYVSIPEGSRAGHPDSHPLRQHDLRGHLARGQRTPASKRPMETALKSIRGSRR